MKDRQMEFISSTKNDRVKNIAALIKSKKARTEQGLFAVEGLRIARDTFKSAAGLLNTVVVNESFLNSNAWKGLPEFEEIGFPDKVPLLAVKDNVFESLCETVTPQGIMCVVRQPEYSYKDLVGSGEELRLLILEDIQDPGNLGTMVRTAEAAGMDGIIMSRGTTDIFSPKVTRSTMGGIFRVPFIYAEDFTGILEKLKGDGVSIYAAYLHDGADYRKVKYSGRAAVMIGNEGNGLSKDAVEHASTNIYIPMAGEVESLNAAIAAALVMYKLGDSD